MSLRHALASLSLLPIVIFSLIPIVIFSQLPISAPPKVFTPQAMVRIQAGVQNL